MARDVRQLRTEAAEASAAGKHKRALSAYLELEQLEPRDAQWSKRAAETYRRLGKDKDAIDAFARAADRYAQSGFLVQAIAVCKLILQVDPKNDMALHRISLMNEQIGAGPTRAASIADNNPTLADSAAVAAIRHRPTDVPLNASGTGSFPQAAPPAEPRRKPPTVPPPLDMQRPRPVPAVGTGPEVAPRTQTPPPPPRSQAPSSPPIAVSRTRSKPVSLPPGFGLDAVSLKEQIPQAFEREQRSGVFVIPIDAPPREHYIEEPVEEDEPINRASMPEIEVIAPDADMDADLVEEPAEIELSEIEEIPLPEPRMMGAAAADALASTPLFAGMSQDALEALVEQLELLQLQAGEVLFHEGDVGDALYVVVEGEVSVQAEGPPRVEMARLGPGSFLGEVALMTDQPRSATVTAATDAELLRIDRNTLANVLANHGEVLAAVLRFVRDRLVDRWMRTSPLFRPFEANERTALAARFKFLEIDASSKLLEAGKKPDGLYIVLAGHFSVRRNGAQVAQLGPGELIGESALLSGGSIKSDVVSRGKALALCLPAADFREMIMTHPHVLEYIGEQAEQSRKLQIL